MKGRRTFLKSVMGALLAAPAASAAGVATDAMATGRMAAGAGPAGAGFLAARHGAYFLVDGLELTAADLARLGIPEPGRPTTEAYAG